MVKEGIILAGGLGTRLKSIVADSPKSMAPINGKPFLSVLFDYLREFGIERIILSIGYKHEQISGYFGDSYQGMSLDYVVETDLLGTGGALAQSLQYVRESKVLLLNGDSFFRIDLDDFDHQFEETGADVLLALKPMSDVSRYGSVKINKKGKVLSFNEKGGSGSGVINGGVYLLRVDNISAELPTGRSSFENDFLAKTDSQINVFGQVFEDMFVDIGTPESYQQAISLLTQ
ncbi:MAG: NTP transferase domain-containing protein [Cytophagia bacterium]|nr:NTP transferase domain-containing protein [Cytophagia bacterium]